MPLTIAVAGIAVKERRVKGKGAVGPLIVPLGSSPLPSKSASQQQRGQIRRKTTPRVGKRAI